MSFYIDENDPTFIEHYNEEDKWWDFDVRVEKDGLMFGVDYHALFITYDEIDELLEIIKKIKESED